MFTSVVNSDLVNNRFWGGEGPLAGHTAVNFTGATEAHGEPGTWTWRAGHLGKASRRGSSPGLLLPTLEREREELEPPWGFVVTCPAPAWLGSLPGQGPGSRPPKWYPPQHGDPHRCSSICPLALLDHAPGLSTNSRTQDRLVTRLLSDWLPPAGPGTHTPARSSHRGLEPCFREVGPPRSNPAHSRVLSRSGARGCSGRRFTARRGLPGATRWR